MKEYIKREMEKNNSLLKHISIILIGSLLGGGMSFIYQILAARVLGPEDYGVFGSLFALVYFVTVSAGVIGTVVNRYTSKYYAEGDYGRIRAIFSNFTFRVFFAGIIVFLLWVLASRAVAGFMNIESVFSVILVGAIGFVALFGPIFDGLLSGLQRFTIKALNGLVGPFFKITFLLLFCYYLGYKVNGGLFAMFLAIIISMISYLIANLSLLKYKKKPVEYEGMMKYALPVILGTVVPMVLITFDIVLVKHYFSSAEAGYYSAVSMLGKIIYFIAGPLVVVMFPKIVNLHTQGKKTDGLLKATLFYAFVISAFCVLAYFVAPTFITNIFYGSDYKISGLVGMFGIALALYSLNSILIMYNLAKNRFGFGYLVAITALIEIVSIIFVHNTLTEIIKILIISFAFLFVCLIFYTRKDLGIRFPALSGFSIFDGK